MQPEGAGEGERVFGMNSFDQGVWLEDRQVLLPWGASLPALRSIGQPLHQPYSAWETLTWPQPTLFHGLHAHEIQAEFYPDAWLSMLWVMIGRSGTLASAMTAFRSTHQHLQRQYGLFKPAQPDTLGPAVDRAAYWTVNDVRLSLFLRRDFSSAAVPFEVYIHVANPASSQPSPTQVQ
jgi:hypothetical protein